MKVKGHENLEKENGMVINNDLSDLDRYKREVEQSKRLKSFESKINSLNDLTKKVDQIFDEIRQIKELLRNRNE